VKKRYTHTATLAINKIAVRSNDGLRYCLIISSYLYSQANKYNTNKVSKENIPEIA
jgi:hypothetical protein